MKKLFYSIHPFNQVIIEDFVTLFLEYSFFQCLSICFMNNNLGYICKIIFLTTEQNILTEEPKKTTLLHNNKCKQNKNVNLQYFDRIMIDIIIFVVVVMCSPIQFTLLTLSPLYLQNDNLHFETFIYPNDDDDHFITKKRYQACSIC